MITQRAVLVGAIGFCLYLIAIVNGLPSYFYILTWLTVSILVTSGGLALLSVAGLACRWRIVQRAASETTPNPSREKQSVGPSIEIELANRGTLSKIGGIIEIRLKHNSRGRYYSRRFLLEALPPATAVSSVLVLAGLPRGRYRVESIRVVGSDVLGLFRAWRGIVKSAPEDEPVPAIERRRSIRSLWNALRRPMAETEAEADIVVGPATAKSGARSNEGASVAAGTETSSSDLVGNSDEMRGIRPFVPGDDLRTVHWKSTARVGHLVVREFDRLARPECVVIWDGGESWGDEGLLFDLMKNGSPVEFGLRVAASLVRALTDEKRPCALLRLDSQPLWVRSQKRGTGEGQFIRCQEALAAANCARTTPLPVALGRWTRDLSESSEVFIVTAAPSSELKESVRSLRALGVRVSVAVLDASAWPDTVALARLRHRRFGRWRQKAAMALLRRSPFMPGEFDSYMSILALGARVSKLELPGHADGAGLGAIRGSLHELLGRRASLRNTTLEAVLS